MAPTQKAAEHAEKVVDASSGEEWDAYVSELGRAGGEFVGGGAEALGLSGASENGATWSLMNGIHPITGERFHTPYWLKVPERWVDGKKLVSTPSYASVFAAPKSVAVLSTTSYADDVLEAHRAAVAEANRFIESQWRVRDRSGSYESLGMIATAHEHHTSRLRVPEPHLHTHQTFMNFAQRASDGKWLAVDYAHFLRIQKAAGIVYQAALRRELALRIPGIEFELHEDGTADIAQIPLKVREAFSTRHFEVLQKEKELAERGVRPGLRRMDVAGYETRSAKGVFDPCEWLGQQRAALAEMGIDDEAIAAWAGQESTVVTASWEVRREQLADRLFGPEGLTEKRNTFNRWDVMEQVGMAHYTDMESFEQVVARTDELLADPRVLAVGEHGRYTVTEIVRLEESVLEAHRTARPRATAGLRTGVAVSERIREAEARRSWELRPGQRAMVEGIASSGSHVEVVEALAGSGKTRSLGVLAEILEHDGFRVIGVAPTGRARLELIQTAGIRESYTLASFKLRARELIAESDRPVVLLTDEAGFASTRELAASISPVLQARGRVVMIGDSGQLGSVGAGGLFAAISRERAREGAVVYRLDEVLRQQTPEGKTDHVEVRALEALHNAQAEEWIALREKRGQLHIHTGPDAGVSAIEQAAGLYLEALERYEASDLYLLSADNAVREAVNERVRAELVDRGAIVEAGEIGGRRFAEGERIALRKNDNEQDLANGMRATILNVNPERGTLTVAIDGEHGGISTLDRDYVTGKTESGQDFVQGGYANTIHTSQGGTSGKTILVGAAQSFDQERAYVGASRAKYATHLITWDGNAPEYFAEHELTALEEAQEVRTQLRDALERSGVEATATEQIAEAGEQLQLDLDLDAAEGPRPGERRTSDVAASVEPEVVREIPENGRTQDSADIATPRTASHAAIEADGEHQLEAWRERHHEIEAEINARIAAREIVAEDIDQLSYRLHKEHNYGYREVLVRAVSEDLASENPWMNSIPESLRSKVAYARLADGITDPRVHPVSPSRYPALWREIEEQRFLELPEAAKHQIHLNDLRAQLQAAPDLARRIELTHEIVRLTVDEPWAQELIPEVDPKLTAHTLGRPAGVTLKEQRYRLLENVASMRANEGVSDPNVLGLNPQAVGIKGTLERALALRQKIEVLNARAKGIELERGIDPDVGLGM
jgi:conjugative relaxase-like TrwC/TraI family protein